MSGSRPRRRSEGGTDTQRFGRLKTGVTAAVLLVLAVVVLFQGRQALEAQGRPVSALFARLQTATTRTELASIEIAARRIVARSPTDSAAVVALAVIEERRGRFDRAEAYMQAASGLTRRNTSINRWLFDHEIRAGRYGEAMVHADIILRMRGDLRPIIFPVLIQAIADPATRKALAVRLAKAPVWRESFMAALVAQAPRPDLPFLVMSETQAAGGAPTAVELGGLVNALVEQKQYDRARAYWASFLPPGQPGTGSSVYNGDFEGWPAIAPFAWNFGPGVQGTIESDKASGRTGKALRLAYDGVTETRFVRQLLLLPPGQHRLFAEARTADYDSGGHIAMTVTCHGDDSRMLSQTTIPDTRLVWRRFGAAFVVPADCPAQWLGFQTLPANRRTPVEVWLDRISLDPAGAGR